MKPTRSGLETQLTQVVQDTFTDLTIKPNVNGIVLPITADGRLSKLRRCLLSKSFKVTRTILGEMRCTVTTYRIIRPSTDLDFESLGNEGEVQVETTFDVIPSWWLVKFGIASVFKFDMLSSQGWQAKMASFNVRSIVHHDTQTMKCFANDIQLVPSDSVIFDFCREGNLQAVQSLLKHGKASVRDITPTGLTPLHVIATFMLPSYSEFF
jgi:hypothetical protein